MKNDLINGRTPEEIKRGIKCHVSWGDCSTECPYDDVRNKPAHECIQSMTKDALAYIEHLEAKQPKWISVKERLPPPGTKIYLIASHSSDGEQIVKSSVWAWNEIGEKGDWINWDVVTHWMPLPEPPKEEG